MFQFYECVNSACRFRFPTELERELPATCPRCSTAVEASGAAYLPRDVDGALPGPVGPLVALLDNLRSTFNVGSIFRIADGAGVDHLHLAGTTATPAHPKLAKTALGAEAAVAWSYHPNSLVVAGELAEAGYQLWALEGGPEAAPFPTAATEVGTLPVALIVGNEKAGVDPLLLERCDRILYLPMSGQKRSLNVAVAFGIAVYLLRLAQLVSGGK